MDYIEQPTLDSFVQMRKSTLSYRVKVTLLFMITQAIRYLKSYSVVHLDIKPNNILVSKTHFTKLIDLGEAYHPSLPNAKSKFAPTQPIDLASPCPTLLRRTFQGSLGQATTYFLWVCWHFSY